MPDSEQPKRFSSLLSEKTLVPLGFVITLLAATIALTSTAADIDKKFTQQEFQDSQILQKVADLSEKLHLMVSRNDFDAREAAWKSWVNLLRAQMPETMRASVPEAPSK